VAFPRPAAPAFARRARLISSLNISDDKSRCGIRLGNRERFNTERTRFSQRRGRCTGFANEKNQLHPRIRVSSIDAQLRWRRNRPRTLKLDENGREWRYCPIVGRANFEQFRPVPAEGGSWHAFSQSRCRMGRVSGHRLPPRPYDCVVPSAHGSCKMNLTTAPVTAYVAIARRPKIREAAYRCASPNDPLLQP